ncbi:MAG TPA: hypothetical protein VGM50_13830 [Gemmatimonadaceae bacterium]|jgi:hypothetical protein
MTRVDDYNTRATAHRAAREKAQRAERAVGIARLVCFLVILTQGAALYYRSEPPAIAWVATIASVGLFGFLIVKNSEARERARLFAALEAQCRDGANRVQRRWEALPAALELSFAPTHAFAEDLHVAGAHSLARLLPTLSRSMGAPVMAEWLLSEVPPSAEVVHTRQRAVEELAPRAEFREQLSVYASRVVGSRATLENFLAWSETRATGSSLGAVRWFARVLGVATVVAFGAALTGAVNPTVPLILVAVNVAMSAIYGRAIKSVLDVIAGHDWRLRGMAEVFAHVVHAPLESPMLITLKERMGGEDAVRAFGAFDRLAKFGEVRLSPMGHFVLQALTLWDFHVVDAVERWRDRNGAQVRERLRALGEFEALAALAALAYDNPAWVMPVVEHDDVNALVATDLSHPLLPAGEGIGNDVRIGRAGQILLITGSNMSGKSTLLRAIGLNTVLAQLGAPVSATSMHLSPHRVRTSIDARDALDRGLSLFMAELLRIKSIVDAARAEAPVPLLYIADEMLRGTNAADRHAAVISILEKLVASGAVGVVATHDPDVANNVGLKAHLDSFHFIEHFDPARTAMPMWFDYKLRPGLSTTRNAIKLLEIVGLG